MDCLTLENLVRNKKLVDMKMLSDSISFVVDGRPNTIQKDEIKNIELFRGIKAFCMRICSEQGKETVHDFANVHESMISKIRSFISQNYGISAVVQELENLATTEGNLTFNNNILYLQSQKQIFSIPKHCIKNIIEVENDIQLDLGDTEIAFNTTSSISQLIGGKSSVETCIVSGVNCINPRSKVNLIFFENYFVMKGSSYDHTIFYDNINEIFYLKNDASFYLVLKLENCISQGQTRYDSLVFQLSDKEMEIVSTDTRLKSFYNGLQYDVVLEIFESLLNLKAQESDLYFKCTSKVFDGYLYFLNQALIFLPKSISIPLQEISHIEFSRINLSKFQARTFDMAVFASKVYNFNGIQKDSFGLIEGYFNENKIKMVSEVIEDSVSNESTDDENESGDLSDIIDSEE